MSKKQVAAAWALSLIALATVTPSRCFAQAINNNEEMAKIFAADQKDREGGMNITPAQWEQINRRDAARREQVRKLLDSSTLKTGEDFEHAAFVFQHGNRAEDYLMAHILAIAAVVRGDAKARWICAATLDRYLQSIKQPQVFGAQYSWTDSAQGRKATQEPYDRTLISDALRQEFCVSSQENQSENVNAISQGKDIPHPDGCR